MISNQFLNHSIIQLSLVNPQDVKSSFCGCCDPLLLQHGAMLSVLSNSAMGSSSLSSSSSLVACEDGGVCSPFRSLACAPEQLTPELLLKMLNANNLGNSAGNPVVAGMLAKDGRTSFRGDEEAT
jgi:hypothetical protein